VDIRSWINHLDGRVGRFMETLPSRLLESRQNAKKNSKVATKFG
jgi:hypothetical protein